MRLKAFAQEEGISYKTAWRWFYTGTLDGYQADTGTIIVSKPVHQVPQPLPEHKVAIYTRFSPTENKSNLDGQAKRLQDYCAAKGYKVEAIVKEVGSGVNDGRPKLMQLLTDPTFTLIVVEHEDRLTRFGFNYIEQLLAMQQRKFEVINRVERGFGPGFCQHHNVLLRAALWPTKV